MLPDRSLVDSIDAMDEADNSDTPMPSSMRKNEAMRSKRSRDRTSDSRSDSMNTGNNGSIAVATLRKARARLSSTLDMLPTAKQEAQDRANSNSPGSEADDAQQPIMRRQKRTRHAPQKLRDAVLV